MYLMVLLELSILVSRGVWKYMEINIFGVNDIVSKRRYLPDAFAYIITFKN